MSDVPEDVAVAASSSQNNRDALISASQREYLVALYEAANEDHQIDLYGATSRQASSEIQRLLRKPEVREVYSQKPPSISQVRALANMWRTICSNGYQVLANQYLTVVPPEDLSAENLANFVSSVSQTEASDMFAVLQEIVGLISSSSSDQGVRF